MEFIIFDTEFTTWEGAQERRWQGPNEYKEIIQIGALKVSWPDAQIIDTLTVYSKPKLNPILSDYCVGLTSIHQDTLNKQGVTFQAALAIFLKFCGKNLVLSYGHDASILAENIVLNEADPLDFYGYNSPLFIDIKYWVLLANKDVSMINSGRLWHYFGNIQHEKFTHEHDPLSDCYSILQVIKYLQETRSKLPF